MPIMSNLKRRLSNLSLAKKLTLIGVVTTTTTLVIAGAAMMIVVVTYARRDLVSDTAIVADLVAANSVASVAFRDANVANETLRAAGANRHLMSAVIVLPEGTVFARYDRDGRRVPSGDSDHGRGFRRERWHAFVDGGLRLASPIVLGRDEVIGAVMRVSGSRLTIATRDFVSRAGSHGNRANRHSEPAIRQTRGCQRRRRDR
jgi:hypothetical protein